MRLYAEFRFLCVGLQVVEQTIMASGLLLLMGSGLVLIIRDITNLRG